MQLHRGDEQRCCSLCWVQQHMPQMRTDKACPTHMPGHVLNRLMRVLHRLAGLPCSSASSQHSVLSKVLYSHGPEGAMFLQAVSPEASHCSHQGRQLFRWQPGVAISRLCYKG